MWTVCTVAFYKSCRKHSSWFSAMSVIMLGSPWIKRYEHFLKQHKDSETFVFQGQVKWQPALAIKVSTWFNVLGCCCTATRSWLKRGWFASVAKGPANHTRRVLQSQTAKTNQQCGTFLAASCFWSWRNKGPPSADALHIAVA